MTLNKGQTFRLLDVHHHFLGRITITRVTADWIHGTFEASSDYKLHQPLFSKHESLVNDQIFSLTDEVEEEIQALGICLIDSHEKEIRIRDIQIMNQTDIVFKVDKLI